MIEFLNPALAWGALAGLIPILVHLIQRRRPRPHAFAAIELVLRSQRRQHRRLRLRRLLLLAARTLILLAIPLALARPRFASPEEKAEAAPRGPAATAIVLDASMSMRWGGGDSLFERARADAREVLASLGSEEPVTVLVCDGVATAAAAPSFDRAAARRQLDDAAPSFRRADLTACLGGAARALGDSQLPGKRIYLATDLTASAFRLDAPPPTVPTPAGEVRPEVKILDAARGRELPNLAVTDLTVSAAPDIGPRGRSFTFTVRNFGGAAVSDVPAELVIGGQVVAKGFVDVPPRGAAVKTLSFRFPSGGAFTGAVRLAPDRLAADDERAFTVRVPRDLQALVVDGAPSTVRYRDEAFFVEAALRAGGGSPVQVTTVDAESFAAKELAGFDLVLLLNVRAPDADEVRRLQEFAAAGGGIFVSLGDQVDPDAYDSALGGLLPRALHLAKTAAERGREDQRPARLGELDGSHPVLRVFGGEALGALREARTFRYFLLQPGRAGDGSRVLASFDDGAPALVERESGRGRVLLFTSTVDRDWSDLAIRPGFLPLLQQTAAYLGRSLEEREPEPVAVGQPHPLSVPEGTEVTAVVGPDGREREVLAAAGDAPSRVDATDRPGLYTVRGSVGGGEVRDLGDLSFAAYADAAESDTRRLEEAELVARLGGEKAEVTSDPVAARERKTPLWSVLAVLATFAFFSEGLLVRK